MTRQALSTLLGSALLLALGLAFVWPAAAEYWRELWLVDACLDQGGSFDYKHMRCDFNTAHAATPFFSRHEGIWLRTVLGLALLAGAVAPLITGPVVRRLRSRAPAV